MSSLMNFCQSFSKKALQSVGIGAATTAVALSAGVFAESASAATIAGVNIDQFASGVRVRGNFSGNNGDYYTAFTDESVETYGYAVDNRGQARFSFTNQVLNGAGADIALFELDRNLGEFKVFINGIAKTYQSVFTGYTTNDNDAFNINVAMVDLSDFGLVDDDFITSLTIDFDTASSPALAVVASLQRSVPEPSAMLGLLATVGFLASQRGLKFAKKAQ